jgi:hypothetical protein
MSNEITQYDKDKDASVLYDINIIQAHRVDHLYHCLALQALGLGIYIKGERKVILASTFVSTLVDVIDDAEFQEIGEKILHLAYKQKEPLVVILLLRVVSLYRIRRKQSYIGGFHLDESTLIPSLLEKNALNQEMKDFFASIESQREEYEKELA